MRSYLLIAAAAVACGGEETRTEVILGLTGDAPTGQTLYDPNCALCHGLAGEGVEDLGSPLASTTLSDEEVVDTILNGKIEEGMTPFADVLTDQQIADINAYVHTL